MGPRTMDKIILKELIAGGMNVARFNFSHGSYEEHAERIALVRQVSEQLGIPVALVLDTKVTGDPYRASQRRQESISGAGKGIYTVYRRARRR